MSRLRNYAREPSHHETDPLSSVMVEKFIDTLLEQQHRLEWFGTRTSDILRLECLFKGLRIKLVHMVPEGHQDYIYSMSFCSGQRKEEVILEVADISRRWGRVKVVNEQFDNASEMFDDALGLFNLIWENVEVFGTITVADRLSYPNVIRNVIDLFSKS